MNRRDFLSLFKLLAVVPFVKPPELSAATTEATISNEEAKGGIIREHYVPDTDGIFSGGKLLDRTVFPLDRPLRNGETITVTWSLNLGLIDDYS